MTDGNEIDHFNVISLDRENIKQDPGIIVLTPSNHLDYSFWEAVSNIGFDVYIFENEDEVEDLLQSRTIDILYICTTDRTKHNHLVTRVKSINRHASVVYFSHTKEILLSDFNSNSQFRSIKDNFKLINSLVNEENHHTVKHIEDVAKYVELLCDRLQVSNNQRILTLSAAHVHDFSHFILENAVECKDEIDVVKLTSQVLKTIGYTSDVCSILDLMYTDINKSNTNKDIFLLANIITSADCYCHCEYNKSKLTLEEFKKLNSFINGKIGTDFLPEVGQALLSILYETISIAQTTNQSCHVLIYNELAEDHLMLKSCLENLGFDTESASSVDMLKDSYLKRQPEILVIEAMGTVLQVSDLVNKIEDQEISFDNVITYILTNNESMFELTGLLQKGIEDIFSAEKDLDPFLIKIIRAKKRISENVQEKIPAFEKIGTFGSLADMNLIDLLQTMNGSGKTCMINVTAQSEQLTIYVHNGLIVYAENDSVLGEKAIFNGMQWNKGIWSFDSVDLSDFPAPNINKPINSILLEGCQHMDESQKITTDSDFNLDETFNLYE